MFPLFLSKSRRPTGGQQGLDSLFIISITNTKTSIEELEVFIT